MAPCMSGPRLLRAAAVLLVTAAAVRSGPLPQNTQFKVKISHTFGTLHEHQCLPDEFDTSSLKETVVKCSNKVQSGDVPNECAGVSLLAQVCNCMANSAGQLVTVDDAKTLNIDMAAIIESCNQKPKTSLGPQQQAVYNNLCISFSLLANCDRQVAHRGAMVPMWRRMYRLRYGVEMVLVVVGKSAEKVWARCTKGLPNINSDIIAEKYADWMTGTLCAMRIFTNDDGTLDTVTMFEKALETDFKENYTDDELPKLQVLCGAGADGSRKVTPSQFIECWIVKGIFILL